MPAIFFTECIPLFCHSFPQICSYFGVIIYFFLFGVLSGWPMGIYCRT
uniref:Uncharacterized protein n=1 Tax=Rhizophora mucronata TaxID=61149 RepID=A0A2P2PHV6_RHIMU